MAMTDHKRAIEKRGIQKTHNFEFFLNRKQAKDIRTLNRDNVTMIPSILYSDQFIDDGIAGINTRPF